MCILAQRAKRSSELVPTPALASLLRDPAGAALTQEQTHCLSYAVNVWGVPQLQPAPKVSLLSWRDKDHCTGLAVHSAAGKRPLNGLRSQPATSYDRSRELTQLITSSSSWEAVAALVRARGREFDRYNCTASWTALAKQHKKMAASGRQEMRADGIFLELEQLTAAVLGSFTARELANVLHSMATVQHQPDPQLLERMKKKLSGNLPRCNGQELTNILWAFAKLAHDPGEELLQRIKAAINRLPPVSNVQSVSNTLWAFATLGHHPGQKLLQRMTKNMSELLPTCSAQGVSNILWAFATMGHHPGQQLFVEFTEAIRKLLPAMAPQGIANILWALASLRQDPGQELLQQMMETLSKLLPDCIPQHVANVLWVCATFGHHPGQELLQRMCHRAGELLPKMLPQDVSNITWALGKLQPVPVPQQLLEGSMGVLLRGIDETAPQSLSNTFLGLAHLGYQPNKRVAKGVALRAAGALDRFKDQELANLTWAFAKLGMDPGDEYCSALYREVPCRATGLNAQMISNILWAIGTLGREPPAEVVDALLGRACDSLVSFSQQDLCNTLWAVATLGIILEPEVVQAFLSVLLKLLPSCTQQSIGNLVWALARMNYCPPDSMWAPIVSEASKRTYEFSAIGFAMTFWGFEQLRVNIDDSILNYAEEVIASGYMRSGDKLDAKNYQVLTKVLETYARKPS